MCHIPYDRSHAFCAGLCIRTPNCGAFAVVDSLCKLADKSGIANEGTGQMDVVFISIEEHFQTGRSSYELLKLISLT